jgi:hypothetical protein
MPLAAIGAIAGLQRRGRWVGTSILPFVGTYSLAPFHGRSDVRLLSCCAMAIIGVVILAFIIKALAPTSGGQQSQPQQPRR